ncbi:ABC transporter ATP-binding protein [uncultured Methylobacterium sp.]|uniref:ABC transporter ATP-binding protein n=1 Tax=uncultured Methylobacterium sp. TaxID=157278 RepID=UPI00259908C6|nr:ABC transporter ATP-binding protein [uncultured Methylobacterium sp.]
MVVRRLNLSIRQGEFLTLLGPSGSGKTTSLMMLAGFETPTAGSILLDGRPIEKLPPHKRNIGVVFQNYALFPHMTVAENVAFPLEMRGIRGGKARERVVRALDMVKMQSFAERKPAQLSGGQQQRIALARAMVFEPSLVLMDEPLGALDKQLREHMQLEIKHLHERLGITVVYVTHDQSEALTMSDRIAVFNDGVIQQLGTPAEIYGAPATPFVAQFIGDNNAVHGRVDTLQAGRCLVRIGDDTCVEAVPVAGLTPGAATILSIRPERIRIGATGDVPSVIEAEVREVIYHGDHVRVRVAALGVEALVIKVAQGTSPTVGLAPGQRIAIGWRPEDCHALQA